jgi:hypothetical protein
MDGIQEEEAGMNGRFLAWRRRPRVQSRKVNGGGNDLAVNRRGGAIVNRRFESDS